MSQFAAQAQRKAHAAQASVTHVIGWQADPDAAAGEDAYVYVHANGRTFHLSVSEGWDEVGNRWVPRYFPQEAIPSPNLLVFNAQGQVLSTEESPVLAQLLRFPNRFFVEAPRQGISPERMILAVGGFGLGSVFYPTLAEADAAVCRAIEGDAWLVSDDPEKARRVRDSAEFLAQEAAASVAHHRQMVERLEGCLKDGPGLLKGAGAWCQELDADSEVYRALLVFWNEPSLEQWGRLAHRIVLPTGKTAWQVWTEHDTTAPAWLPEGEGFSRCPDPEAFFGWLRESAQAALAYHREAFERTSAEIEHF